MTSTALRSSEIDFAWTNSGNRTIRALLLGLTCLTMSASSIGCSTLSLLVTGIPAIPAHRVPPEFLGRPRTEMQEISLARLRQNPPKVYQLDANDVLGIYIENVLGDPETPPPVNFPLDGSKAPSLGFPIPVREDGTLALPLVDPIPVTGLTLTQAADKIREAYTVKKKILPEGRDRIIVTLQRPREYRVLVIREEGGNNSNSSHLGGGMSGQMSLGLGNAKRGTGDNVLLPAYENDLLTALTKTGGLPGLDAQNEVLILRGDFGDAAARDEMIARMKSCKDPCECEDELPPDANIVRIPIRFFPENLPTFKQQDIILKTGDIVFVQSRDRELYYTTGVIRGGAQPIPRDYDIDILQAIALSGGNVAPGGTGVGNLSGSGGYSGGGGGAMMGATPSRAIVLRKTCNGGEIPIRVDLRRALINPSERILIQPEDTIIVQYTFLEEIYNAALRTVSFNFLMNGLSGGGF